MSKDGNKCAGCNPDHCRCDAINFQQQQHQGVAVAGLAMGLKHAAAQAIGLDSLDLKHADSAMAGHIRGKEEMREQQAQTPRAAILNEAMKITHQDRNANYGNPEDNFKNIAALWNAYWIPKVQRLEKPSGFTPQFGPEDVAVMNMLIKVARLSNNPNHHDSAVDIAGYAACLGDIQASKSAVGR